MKTLLLLALAVSGPMALAPVKKSGWPKAEGTLVVVSQQDHNVNLIDLRTGKIVHTVAVGTGPHEAAVSPSGKLVAVTNYGNKEVVGDSLTIIELLAPRC